MKTFSFAILAIVLLTGSLFAQDAAKVISIAESKKLANKTFVTVSGTVTANNLAAAYIQDASGGIGVYDRAFKRDVKVGDSVIITGELMEFGSKDGALNTGLRQISGAQGFQYKVVGKGSITPIEIEGDAIGEEFDCRLVTIKSCLFEKRGDFTAGKNYKVTAPKGSFFIRIDKFTDIPDQPIPEQPLTITGVVSRYMGKYQILPRSENDLILE